MVTPLRNLRVPDEKWDAWKAEAARRGMTLTGWLTETADRALPGDQTARQGAASPSTSSGEGDAAAEDQIPDALLWRGEDE